MFRSEFSIVDVGRALLVNRLLHASTLYRKKSPRQNTKGAAGVPALPPFDCAGSTPLWFFHFLVFV
jgi:hypothetical protein